ncbi:MAG: alpha/beta hydrolase [Proteobacteria bacterium]|nr:alpha/beta hydrolase [Pseudomonadota bacterium]
MSVIGKGLLVAAALAGGVYLALLALLWWGQERLLFQPEPLPPAHRFDFGADVHERWIDVPGARLSALHLQLPAPKGLVFYLHGNAGNLQSWFVDPDFWRRANFDLLMIDYRGYGKSSGRVGSQAELLADARAALAAVMPRYAGRRLVIFGRSLGSGVAAELAAELQPDLTVLVSPYFSLQALASEIYPWVPGALLRYPLRSDQWLPRIKGPVLLIHGRRDELIAPAHAERLAALAPQARLLLLPDAGHNDLQQFQAYLDGLRGALDRL